MAQAIAEPFANFCSHIALPKTKTLRAKSEFPRDRAGVVVSL